MEVQSHGLSSACRMVLKQAPVCINTVLKAQLLLEMLTELLGVVVSSRNGQVHHGPQRVGI